MLNTSRTRNTDWYRQKNDRLGELICEMRYHRLRHRTAGGPPDERFGLLGIANNFSFIGEMAERAARSLRPLGEMIRDFT
jgi:hypothetical protein